MGQLTKNRLLFVLICLIFTGCRPIKSTQDSFSKTTYCYTGTSQYLEKLPIKIQGYYRMIQPSKANGSNPEQPQMIIIDVIFFNDGSFVYYFVPKWLDGSHWGTYYIEKDTIKGHFIEPPRGMSWETGYVWFKIIDQNSIKELHYKYRTPIIIEEITEKKNEDMPVGQFISLDSLSYQQVYKKNWLKKRKWYWCNEVEFLEWKKQQKK